MVPADDGGVECNGTDAAALELLVGEIRSWPAMRAAASPSKGCCGGDLATGLTGDVPVAPYDEAVGESVASVLVVLGDPLGKVAVVVHVEVVLVADVVVEFKLAKCFGLILIDEKRTRRSAAVVGNPYENRWAMVACDLVAAGVVVVDEGEDDVAVKGFGDT